MLGEVPEQQRNCRAAPGLRVTLYSSMAAANTHSSSFARTLASAKQTMVLERDYVARLDSFRNNKVRFALTALGMVMGSASVILVATIGLTGRQYAINLIQGIGANMIVADCQCGGMNPDSLTYEDLTAVDQQVPGIIWSSPMLEMQVPISFGDGKVKDILILGVSPQYKDVRNLVVLYGRFFDQEDTISHAKVAVVTVPFAESLFGSADRAINRTFTIRGIPFTIIGVFKEEVNTLGNVRNCKADHPDSLPGGAIFHRNQRREAVVLFCSKFWRHAAGAG